MAEAAMDVVAYLRGATKEVAREQTAIARIACMDERADGRAAHLIKALRAEGLAPRRDKAGNVIATRPGVKPASRATLVVSAHLDSVFLGLAPIKVRRKGAVLHAPGICDDAAGVANLIMLARALRRCKASTAGDVVFVGSAGEEGGLDTWGMKYFWENARIRQPLFVGIDGAIPGRIVTRALGTWTATITVKGPGGHSYVSFGRPNPIHVVSRLVAKVTSIKADRSKDAAYNATIVTGGHTSNVIPDEASVTLNVRSSDAKTLAAMRSRVLRFLEEARREELAWATSEKKLSVEVTSSGRPGGCTREDHPLVVAAAKALHAERVKPRYMASSTDANAAMALGIPAITVSAGGRAENMHSTSEWHDMTGRTKELAALGRIVLSVVG